MNVLAIGCHPDDLEIGCAGTLAKCARRGDRVVMASLANGNVGHREMSKQEIARVRAIEAKNSAAVIGAEQFCLGIDDLCVKSRYEEGLKKVTELIRFAKPDFIITHGQNEYMVDHNMTGQIVFDASMAATVNHYATETESYNHFTPIYRMESTMLVDSFPDEFVDVTDTIDLKLEMLGKHRSQLDWLLAHDHYDILDMVKCFARTRGYQCDVGYVEGFTLTKQAHHLPLKRFLP